MDITKMLQISENAYRQKDYKTAISALVDMVKSGYASGQVLCNLGALFATTNQFQLAVNSYQEALKIEPKFMATYHNFGNLLKRLGKNKDALQVYIMGIRQNPKDFNLHNNIGMMYEVLGQTNNAIEAYKNAIKVNPKFAKAINNLGVVLYKQKRYEESAAIFQIALDVDPNYHEVYSNMGAALNKAKRYDESIQALQTAIKKLPNHGGAYTNLGNVYSKLHDYKKAQELHEKSIQLEPKGSNAYANLGSALKNQGLMSKAIENYKKALELDPNFVNAHFDLSTALLTIGEFEEGLKEYEWRFKKDEMIPHIIKYKEIFSKPMLLKNTNAKDKIVLIHSEQGFGDSLMYARFIPKLKAKFGCKVIFKARDELVELFENNCDIDEVTYRTNPTPEFDYHVPIMSLAYILECKEEKDFYSKPYIAAIDDEDLKIEKLSKKPNIGICWSASVTGESYDGKVFDLSYLEPLIKSTSLNIYSLQVGEGSEEIEKYGYEDNIIDITAKLTNFAKTASLVKQLDLVITSDTSVAHLCGAMGVKTWVILQKYPDWRWTNKGEKSYMYPTNMKLIRQKTARSWDSVFQSVYDRVQKEFKIKL